MGIIYKITNTVNGHSYIGQTRCSLQKRWNEHIRDSKRCDYKFHRAIRKYGENAFHAEVIETVPDDQLNEREVYWVDYYDTYSNGYNSTLGGNTPKYIDSDKIIELWDNGLSVKEIHEELGYSFNVISNRLQGHDSFSHEESLRRGYADIQKRVCQYDCNGQYIQTFDSINAAAKHYNIDRTLISVCCRKKIWTGAGYQWRFEGDDPPGEYKKFNKKPVLQYSNTGELLHEFASISEVERFMNCNRYKIVKCCSGEIESAFGYVWKYAS